MRVRKTANYSRQIDALDLILDLIDEMNTLPIENFQRKYIDEGIPDVMLTFRSKNLKYTLKRYHEMFGYGAPIADFNTVAHILASSNYTPEGLSNLLVVLTFLQQNGFRFDKKNQDEATPLHLACAKRNIVMMRFLCDLYKDDKAFINNGDVTPLEFCAAKLESETNVLNDVEDAIRLMLEYGATMSTQAWESTLKELDADFKQEMIDKGYYKPQPITQQAAKNPDITNLSDQVAELEACVSQFAVQIEKLEAVKNALMEKIEGLKEVMENRQQEQQSRRIGMF